MRRRVVNADDFGLSPGVNEGIVAAHADGIVTSASLMVLAPGAELDHVRRPFLLEPIADKAGEGLTELACHPARLTGDFSSSYLDERAVELATLTEPGLGAEISALGVWLVSYRAWASGS